MNKIPERQKYSPLAEENIQKTIKKQNELILEDLKEAGFEQVPNKASFFGYTYAKEKLTVRVYVREHVKDGMRFGVPCVSVEYLTKGGKYSLSSYKAKDTIKNVASAIKKLEAVVKYKSNQLK